MKKVVFSFLIIFFLFTTRLVFPFTLLGGKTLNVHEQGLRAAVGFPGLYGVYHIPISKGFEINPKFTFFYGLDTYVPVVGDTLGVEVRINLIELDKFALALLFDPAFILLYHPDFAMGFQIGGPGVSVNYTFEKKHHLIGGFQIPFGFIFYKRFIAVIPISFKLGGEFGIGKDLNFYLLMEMGPDILAAKGGSITRFRPVVTMGISYKF